jgi:hypothetical protein
VEADRGPSKIEFDHERRLIALERELADVKHTVQEMEPQVNEVLLAKRVAAGVTAALDERETSGLNRWQKVSLIVGLITGVIGGTIAGVAAILQAVGHG